MSNPTTPAQTVPPNNLNNNGFSPNSPISTPTSPNSSNSVASKLIRLAKGLKPKKSSKSLNSLKSTISSPLQTPPLDEENSFKFVEQSQFREETNPETELDLGSVIPSNFITPSSSFDPLPSTASISTPPIIFQPLSNLLPPMIPLSASTTSLASTSLAPSLHLEASTASNVENTSPVKLRSPSSRPPTIVPRPTKSSLLRSNTTSSLGANTRGGAAFSSPIVKKEVNVMGTAERARAARRGTGAASGRRDSSVGAGRRGSMMPGGEKIEVKMNRTTAMRTGVAWESPIKSRPSNSNLSKSVKEAINSSSASTLVKETVISSSASTLVDEINDLGGGTEEDLSVHTRNSSNRSEEEIESISGLSIMSTISSGAKSDRVPIGMVPILIPPQLEKLRLALEKKRDRLISNASFEGVPGHKQISSSPIVIKPPTITPRLNRSTVLRSGQPDPQPLRPPPSLSASSSLKLKARPKPKPESTRVIPEPVLQPKMNRTELLRFNKRNDDLVQNHKEETIKLRRMGARDGNTPAFI